MSDFVNEISRELIGPSNVNPFVMFESASRIAMANKQIGQAVVVAEPDIPIWLTGTEREYGKYTHGVNMPVNGKILRVIQKYPMQISDSSERPNPKTVVIFEDFDRSFDDPRRFDCIEINTYHYLHQTWGHRNEPKEGFSKLIPGEYIKKDTPIVGTPNLDNAGNYRLGVEANVALMTHPCGIEDGIGVRRGYLKKFRTRAYGRRIVTYSDGRFPINLYGDVNNYKAFPDIGDVVRQDGLLFATRQYTEALGPLQVTKRATQRASKLFDDPIYAPPGAKVVDINVYRSNSVKQEMPTGTFGQLVHYRDRLNQYHREIMDVYNFVQREYGEEVRISPRFSNLVTDAMFYVNQGGRERIDFSVKKVPVGEWYAEIIYEYEVEPTLGSKMSGLSGDKGVITYIFEDEDAPRDANGDMVDIMMEPDSTIKRMNLGRLIRQYGSSSARATQLKVKAMVAPGTPEAYDQAYDYILGWYKVASPEMFDAITTIIQSRDDVVSHVDEIVRNGFHVYRPVESRQPGTEMIEEMLNKYPALYDSIEYRDLAGNWQRTKDPILVGRMYILLLDKMANSFSSIASPKFQHYGIPAKVSALDKYATTGRANPLRVLGETEMRIITSVGAGPGAIELHDLSNNPASQRAAVRNIQEADNPMQIPEVICRKENPLGFARPHQHVFHMLETAGIGFVIKEQK